MNRRQVAVALAAIVLVLFIASPMLAAEGSEESPVNTTLGWVFRWLNFALLFGGAGYLIAKKAPGLFCSRSEAIVASIQDSTRAKDEAGRRLREAEEKLRRLDVEVAGLRAAAQHDMAAEADRIRTVALDEVQKVERAAKAELEAAERAARMELKAMVARMSVERAETLIRQQMSREAEATLFRTFVESLERGAN